MLISRFDAGLYFGTADVRSAGTTALSNVLEIGKADPSRMNVEIHVATAGAGGTNMQFVVQGSDDNSTYATVAESPVIATASLVKDAHFQIGIPQGFKNKYMRVAVVSTGTFTAGTVEASLDVYTGV